MNPITLTPIGFVKNKRTEISDDFWGSVVSEIELLESFSEDAFEGIDAFSHLEIVFYFHRADKEKTLYSSGHPRGNTNFPKVGIFAQRKKDRPNLLGTTIVKLLKREGKRISVSNFDAIDGTIVLDIKPIFKEFLPKENITQPKWVNELMEDYWK